MELGVQTAVFALSTRGESLPNSASDEAVFFPGDMGYLSPGWQVTWKTERSREQDSLRQVVQEARPELVMRRASYPFDFETWYQPTLSLDSFLLCSAYLDDLPYFSQVEPLIRPCIIPPVPVDVN